MLRSKRIGDGSRAEVETLIDAYAEQNSTAQHSTTHTSVGREKKTIDDV